MPLTTQLLCLTVAIIDVHMTVFNQTYEPTSRLVICWVLVGIWFSKRLEPFDGPLTRVQGHVADKFQGHPLPGFIGTAGSGSPFHSQSAEFEARQLKYSRSYTPCEFLISDLTLVL